MSKTIFRPVPLHDYKCTNVQCKIQLSKVKDTSRIKCMSEREVKESCDKTQSTAILQYTLDQLGNTIKQSMVAYKCTVLTYIWEL